MWCWYPPGLGEKSVDGLVLQLVYIPSCWIV